LTKTRVGEIVLTFEPLLLKTAHPFGISYGTSETSENVLVRMKYKDFEGLGEASPASYHNETVPTVMAVLERWQKSDIFGDDPFAIAEIAKRMDKSVAGNFSAKAAVEMALYDLAGKIAGLPTYKMLGLAGLERPITDFTIGIDSLEMIEKKTYEAVEAGYKVLKVKQGTSYDKDIIRKVRSAAPLIPIRVDANGAWNPKQAIEMSKWLAEQNVQFIEQPLPKNASVDDFRFVREHSPLPIYADESVSRSYDAARLAGAVDGIVVKLAKTGGLLEALKLIHTARAHSMQIMFGCMIECSIGITAAAHLASLVDHLDLDGQLLLAEDPFDGCVYNNGYLDLPDRPGLGVIPRGKK